VLIKVFAIFETGGKQYKVSPGQKMKIEKLEAAAGGNVVFDKVLLKGGEAAVEIGAPHLAGARVEARVLKQGRNHKIIVFRYHSKTRSKKKKGHRQRYTEVEIIAIK